MLSRKSEESKKFRTQVPRDYLALVEEAFKENFAEQITKDQQFYSTAELYMSEVLMAVALITKNQLKCLTCSVSVDFDSGKGALEEVLKDMVDCAANFFDEHFHEPSKEYAPTWNKVKFNNRDVFVRISTENPAIDRMADDILEKNDSLYDDSEGEE